ncbi:unnamed protein product, partial [Sphenostylis stenocarpa]
TMGPMDPCPSLNGGFLTLFAEPSKNLGLQLPPFTRPIDYGLMCRKIDWRVKELTFLHGCPSDAPLVVVADPLDDECNMMLSSRCFLATEADPSDDMCEASGCSFGEVVDPSICRMLLR